MRKQPTGKSYYTGVVEWHASCYAPVDHLSGRAPGQPGRFVSGSP